jgi:hypothetical protein
MGFPAMIDLEEAARSFASYTLQLDLQCLEYGLVTGADAEPQPSGIESQTTSRKDEVIDRMRQSCREAAVISILVHRKLTEVMQSGAESELLSKFINASNRMVVASQKARALIEEHERKEKAKDVPPEANPTVIAIWQFREKQAEERAILRKHPPDPVD